MYLLDTNVISELRKARPHGAVLAWVQKNHDVHLHLSAMTIAEIQAGIEITREQNASKAAEIEAWLDQLANAYNVLPIDVRTARHAARLMHRRSSVLYEDAIIAATAQVHQLVVVTRNTADFDTFGVPLLNPFLAQG